MNKSREKRDKIIKLRVNSSEIKKMKSLQEKSTIKNLSDYIRKVCLQQPITIKIRNQSAEDFLEEMIALKKELNAIGNNLNQAVHKLHTLDRIPDFRSWLNLYESTRKTVLQRVENIAEKINGIYTKWSQE